MTPERKAQLREVAGKFGDFETLGLIEDLDRAEERFNRIFIGENHLAAALIGMLGAGETFPGYRTPPDKARASIGDPDKYDAWMCWSVIMLVRDEVNGA